MKSAMKWSGELGRIADISSSSTIPVRGSHGTCSRHQQFSSVIHICSVHRLAHTDKRSTNHVMSNPIDLRKSILYLLKHNGINTIEGLGTQPYSLVQIVRCRETN